MSRSFFRLLAIAINTSLFLGCAETETKQDTAPPPTGLMVDLLTQPENAVITNPKPYFSWVVTDTAQGAMQEGYQILVADSKGDIESNRGNVWDSGPVGSGQSVNVPFEGKGLAPNTIYWWKVSSRGSSREPGAYSQPQMFRTGDFEDDDRKWPGESKWVELEGEDGSGFVFENRHQISYHDIPPVTVGKNDKGHHFIAFEKAAFGTLKLTIDPSKVDGDSLVVHLGEKNTANQGVDRDPGGSVVYTSVKLGPETDKKEYILELPRQYSKYPNSQVLADHMQEVTSFRFVEIENYGAELTEKDVAQHALLYRFDEGASHFFSSDDKLNQVWELCKHTLKVTPFFGLYIDGTRERMPYEADAYIQQISHYCVDREYAIQRYTKEFLIFNPSWPTEWHLHIVPMAWADYMQTGDMRSMEKYYEEYQKKTLIDLAREDGLISTKSDKVTKEFLQSIHYEGNSFRDIVDWPQGTPFNEEGNKSGHGSERVEGETDRYVFAEINTVVNAFHYRNLLLMSRIAELLGKGEDAVFYYERSEKVKNAINEKLLDKESGLYLDGEGVAHSSLHANMFPVAFGLAPLGNHEPILAHLKSKGMACSPYGAPYLMEALYHLRAGDYAMELLTSETDRSWMNMLRLGATVTTEAWDMKYKKNMTWNHAWGASPAYVITRKLMGIEPLQPTFEKVQVRPQLGGLESAEITTPTIRGPIKANMSQKADGGLEMELEIPANMTARIMLPQPEKENFTLIHNGTETAPILQEGWVVMDPVVSGRHRFRIE